MAVKPEPRASLIVRLSRAGARIDCSEPTLHERLTAVLQHCSGSSANPEVRFSVSRSSEQYLRLERHGWQLYEGDNVEYLSHLLLHELLIELIRGCTDELVLHSGAVARGLQGLLLCGESESGKSTLSAWLTASGFDYLTDELAVVSLDGGALTGLPRAIMLRGGSKFVLEHWLDERGTKALTRFSSTTVAVDPETLRPDSVCRRARPKAVFFPRFDADKPLVGRRLSSAEATLRLVQSSANAAQLPEGGIPAVMALARAVAAYALRYPDAASAAAWIESRVDG